MKRFLLIIFLLTLFSAFNLAQQNKTIEVNYKSKDYFIPAYEREGMYYISIEEICKILNIGYLFDTQTKKIEVTNNKYFFKIFARNPFIFKKEKISNEISIIQLPTSTYYFKDKLFLPLKYSLQILEGITLSDINFIEPNKLTISDKLVVKQGEKIDIKYDVEGITVEEKANGTLITLKSKKRIPSYASSFKNNIITFIFRKVTGDSSKIKFDGTGGVVKQISSRNVGNDLEVQVFVGPEYTNNEVLNSSKGNDILITIHNRLFKKTELVNKKEKWAFKVIVIDPGHGGKDPGAIGVNGAKEKDINLAIALKLGQLIKENLKGVKVVYTRKTDTFIELYKRGKISNDNNGNLFISIHCNSTPQKPSETRGFEVYLLRAGRTKEAISIAEFENSVIHYEDNPERYQKLTDENFILVSMAQSAYMRFSEKFAELLHQEFSEHQVLKSRGVKQAGFYVLVGASMPNVLIEAGYLSNKKDADYLNSIKGQTEIANSIFNGIKKYIRHYELEMETN